MDNEIQPTPEGYEEVQRSEFDALVNETKQEIEQGIQAELRAQCKAELDSHRGETLFQVFTRSKYREMGLDQQVDWTNAQIQAELERRILAKSQDLNRRTYEAVQKNIFEANQKNLQNGFDDEVKQLRGMEPTSRSRKYAEICSIYRQKGLKV